MSITNVFEESKELTPTEAENELNETMLMILRKTVTKKILEISPNIFMTGSFHWFGKMLTEKSDFDICVPFMCKQEVETLKTSYSLVSKSSHYNDGEYIKFGNEVVNLIFLQQKELKAWKVATDVMEFLVKEFSSIMVKKAIRVSVFQSLVALVKMLNIMGGEK